jgi:hypothetical protein
MTAWGNPSTVAVAVSAVATAVMAFFTARSASKIADQTELVKEQVTLERRQFELAVQGVQTSVKPFLVVGDPHDDAAIERHGGSVTRLGVTGNAESMLKPLLMFGEGASLNASLSLRNVGAGLAIVEPRNSCVVGWSDPNGPNRSLIPIGIALLPDPVLPHNETTEIRFDLDLSRWMTDFNTITDQIRGVTGELFFDVVYGDARGSQRVRARFHAARTSSNNAWHIFETHYFDPVDSEESSLEITATTVTRLEGR